MEGQVVIIRVMITSGRTFHINESVCRQFSLLIIIDVIKVTLPGYREDKGATGSRNAMKFTEPDMLVVFAEVREC
jgi:hypothetical protein